MKRFNPKKMPYWVELYEIKRGKKQRLLRMPISDRELKMICSIRIKKWKLVKRKQVFKNKKSQ